MTNLSPGIQTREVDFSYYVKHLSTSSAAMVGVAERGPINKPVILTSWEQFVTRFGPYIQAGYLAYAGRAFFDNGGSVLYVNRIAHLSDPTDRNSLTAATSEVTFWDRRRVPASLGTGTAGVDLIRWVAHGASAWGNTIQVELVGAGTNMPLSVNVAGRKIQVNLETDKAEAVISTAAEVVAALTASPETKQLVHVSTQDNGIVQPVAETNLAGGVDSHHTLRVSAAKEGRWGDALAVRIEDGARDPDARFNLVVIYKGEDVEVFEDLTMDESASNHVELAVNGRSEFIRVKDLSPSSGTAEGRPQVGTFYFYNGDDGLAGLTDADYIGDPSAHTGFYAFDEIDSLNLLMAPGVTTAAVIHGGIAYAEKRKDLMFLAEAPLHLEPQEAVEFRRGQGMLLARGV